MTNPTPHGQVPEALIDLIDAYAETRHRCGGIYNAKTEAARNAVIEALSEVQALSAAPAIAKLRHLYQNMVNGAVRDTASAKRIAEGLLAPAIEALERATPPAEQQAAPKAAPVEQDDHQILAITTAYEQGVGKGHQAYNSGKEIANPYSPAYRCDLAWQYGYKEGKEQAQREAKAAPRQEAQEPAVDDPTRWLTVVYRDISPGDEARLLGEHPKASAMSWSHAMRDRDAARAVLAKWGTQPQAGAVPQGWKAVPVNPTPEMWKAAKTVPDPNPPYPPHYGLVWDAMLAASPTPPAEQQAAPKAARGELAESAAKGAIMGAAYDFRDAHISGSMNLKRSAHAALEAAVDNALAAPLPAPAPLSECLRLLNSFEYEGDEDSQAKAFFKAHINEDWFFHVKNSLELALAAQGGKA